MMTSALESVRATAMRCVEVSGLLLSTRFAVTVRSGWRSSLLSSVEVLSIVVGVLLLAQQMGGQEEGFGLPLTLTMHTGSVSLG